MTFNDNTVSVVIGGTSGIGAAVASALMQRPGRVEIASRATGLDIADSTAVAAYFHKLGPIDHLIVTAGSAAPGGKISDIDLNAAKAAFDVKFWGSVVLAREAARYMRAGGTITFTSGFLARRTVPGTFEGAGQGTGTAARQRRQPRVDADGGLCRHGRRGARRNV